MHMFRNCSMRVVKHGELCWRFFLCDSCPVHEAVRVREAYYRLLFV